MTSNKRLPLYTMTHLAESRIAISRPFPFHPKPSRRRGAYLVPIGERLVPALTYVHRSRWEGRSQFLLRNRTADVADRFKYLDHRRRIVLHRLRSGVHLRGKSHVHSLLPGFVTHISLLQVGQISLGSS